MEVSIALLVVASINLVATICTPVVISLAYLIKTISHSDCCLGVCDIDTRDPDQTSPPKKKLQKDNNNNLNQ